MSFADQRDFRQSGFQDTSLKPAPKRLIVCCDGTWQSSVTNATNIPSNVTRLARYLLKVGRDEQNQEWQQLVYYDAGIGTGVADLEAKRQGGTGSGFVGNVIEAYNFIVLNYNPGDQVFCFGFSRGAYTARAVAGLVNDIGIIKPRDMQDFPELYHLYQDHTESHTFRKTKAWREWVEGKRLSKTTEEKGRAAEKQSWREYFAGKPKPKAVPGEVNIAAAPFEQSLYQWEKRPHGAAPESTRWVEAVGVFDTVGSLGLPDMEGWFSRTINYLGKWVPSERFGFHNVSLSPYIKHAYHAMALDEHRKPFDTTLWRYPETPKAKHVHNEPEKLSAEDLRDNYRQLLVSDDAKDDDLQELWEDLVDAEMAAELKGTKSKLSQVWFPGYHINVGGGSDDLLKKQESDFEQIATITLAWMVEHLRSHLAFEINFTDLCKQDRFLLMRPVVDKLLGEPLDAHKDHWLVQKIDSLLEQQPKHDPWNDKNKTRRKVLAGDALMGWASGPIIENFVGDVKKAGRKDRTPGEYHDVESTCEEIHPTVWYRKEHLGKAGYDPVPLQKFDRVPRADGNGYEWVKGNVRIPEYKIRDGPSYERSFVVSASAKEFLGRLDKENGIDSFEAKALDAAPEQPATNHGFQPNGSGF